MKELRMGRWRFCGMKPENIWYIALLSIVHHLSILNVSSKRCITKLIKIFLKSLGGVFWTWLNSGTYLLHLYKWTFFQFSQHFQNDPNFDVRTCQRFILVLNICSFSHVHVEKKRFSVTSTKYKMMYIELKKLISSQNYLSLLRKLNHL